MRNILSLSSRTSAPLHGDSRVFLNIITIADGHSTESVLWLETSDNSDRPVDQAVCREALTAEVRARSQVRLCDVVDKVALGLVFLRVLQFSPFIIFRSSTIFS